MHENTRAPRKPGSRAGLGALALVMALAVPGGAFADEMLVVGSTAPGLAPGDIAPTGAAIEIPRDAQVTLVSPSGGVVKIEGPWSGRIDGPEAAEGPSLIQRLYALFQMPDRRARFGATRSLSRCLVVDLEQDDDICVGQPSCVVFQSEGRPQEPVTLTGPDGRRIALDQGLGSGMWRWPVDQVTESGTYQVHAGDAPATKSLDVHLQPKLPTRAHEIAWMGEAGCVRQAQEALTEMVAK